MKQYLIFYLSLLLFICSSCSKDEITPVPPDPDVEKRVIFELTENDENRISTVDVLAFKVDANDNTKEYFAYRTQGKDLTDNGAPNKKKFNVSLLKSTNVKYRFVLLANCRNELDGLGKIDTTTLKQDIFANLISNHADKWITNTADPSFIDFPMWAESSQITVNDNTKTITDIHLIRLLARIDVNVNQALSSIFKLKSVRIYNYNTYGQVVPSTISANWDGNKVLKPTIPSNNGKTEGPLVYTDITNNLTITSGIYVYEVLNSGVVDSKNTICVVVGGEYNNTGKESFFRIDFANTDENGKVTYIDILRNHLYNVKIVDIRGTGFDSPEIAFQSEGINILSDIVILEQGGLADYIFDGQNYLGISKSNFTLPLNERTIENQDNQLTIVTDYENGWIIDKIVDINNQPVSWLSTNISSGIKANKTTISILTQLNDSEIDRTAFIHIKAGKLVYKVEVTQNTIPELELLVTNLDGDEISDLLFHANVNGVVIPQQLVITWLPKTASNFVSVSPVLGSSNFNFGTGDRISPGNILDAYGFKTYNIQPPAMTQAEIDANPFLEKALRIDFSVSNNVSFESKVLFLLQKNYAAIPNIDTNFLMDGTEQYFVINANAPWEIEVTSDPNNIISRLTTIRGGQYEDKRDEKVYFTTINDMSSQSIREGVVIFTIKSTNAGRPFPDKQVTVNFYSGEILPLSNSYQLNTSNVLPKSYLIPVSRANEAIPGSIGTTDKLEVSILWTDEVSHTSSIILKPIGRGSNGYIYLYPPISLQGNTIIAARVNSVIKWSWHLWMLNADLSALSTTLGEYILMDRNLGALNPSKGHYYSTGLFYQWGRKDPFPPSAGTGSTINEKIYNASGQSITMSSSTSTAGLLFTVQNPLSYLISPTNWAGSAGAVSWDNGGKKTIYDPCPPGWKMPVASVWSNLNTSNFIWDGINRGRNHNNAGWFPASGIRSRTNSNLGNVGTIGAYWSATWGTPYVPTLDLNVSAVNPSMNYYYFDGAVVRCIKEQ